MMSWPALASAGAIALSNPELKRNRLRAARSCFARFFCDIFVCAALVATTAKYTVKNNGCVRRRL
jgi:hypothetical protein